MSQRRICLHQTLRNKLFVGFLTEAGITDSLTKDKIKALYKDKEVIKHAVENDKPIMLWCIKDALGDGFIQALQDIPLTQDNLHILDKVIESPQLDELTLLNAEGEFEFEDELKLRLGAYNIKIQIF